MSTALYSQSPPVIHTTETLTNRMLHVVLLACVVASSLAQKDFFDDYSFTKVMTDCLGKHNYDAFQLEVLRAVKTCDYLPVSDPGLTSSTTTYNSVPGVLGYDTAPVAPPVVYQYPVPTTGVFSHTGVPTTLYQTPVVTHGHKRETRQASDGPPLDADFVRGQVNKVISAVSNYTCVLQTLKAVDKDLNVDFNSWINNYYALPIDLNLKNDLIEGVLFCRDLVTCLPVERTKNPIPAPVQRLFAFMECERKSRLTSCFKQDIRKHLNYFDLSALPDRGGRSGPVEVLTALLVWGESTHELKVQ